MSTKWKKVNRRALPYFVPRICGKVQLERSTIFHVHKVEKFNRKDLQYFMSTGWKSLTGEAYNISYPRGEIINGRVLRYFMSTEWKSFAPELSYISCPRSGKVLLESSTIFHVHEAENINWRTLRYFMSTKWKN